MIVKIEGNDIFLADQTHQHLIEALAKVGPDPFTGRIEPWQFVEVLGEVGGIWTAETLTDPARVAA